MLRTVIVDDERRVRETLIGMLKMYCPDVEVVAEFSDLATAEDQLPSLQPGLVLLDVQLENGTGFDLLRRLPQVNFKVIFITAHDSYAVEAFQFSALDYLMKPVDPEDLIRAIQRAGEVIRLEQTQMQLAALMTNLGEQSSKQRKLVLKTTESVHLVDIGDIIRCEANRNYTMFHFSNDSKLLVSRTLKEFHDLLTKHGFYRIHQSHLINLAYFDRYEKTDGGYVVLKNGHEVGVAMRKREAFLKHLETL